MKKRTRWWLLVFVTVLAVVIAVLLWFRRCPIRYEVIFLPTEIRFIRDINDTGSVVGVGVGAKINHAFVWSEADGLRDLGTFGYSKAWGVDINNAGQILISVVDPNDKYQALLFDPKTGVTNLGSLGGKGTFPRVMNEHAQIVGMSITASGGRRAFYWDGVSGMVDLGILGGTPTGRCASDAFDISESGQVVGGSSTGAGSQSHAFIWTADSGMVDLMPSSTFSSKAGSINSKGKIVGSMTDGSDKHFWCFWDANNAGGPGISSPASGILLQVNDSEQILGYIEQKRPFDKTINKYFIEDPQKGRVYLDRFIKLKGWRMEWPVMSNRGWIAANIIDEDGIYRRPVLLKPVEK